MNGILEIRSSLLKTTNDSRVGICESEVNSSTYMYIHVKEPNNQNQFKLFSFRYLKSDLDLIILIN